MTKIWLNESPFFKSSRMCSKEPVLVCLKLKGNILRIKCHCKQTLGCAGGWSRDKLNEIFGESE